jgi:trimethylamine--corrinoid protein Co-methyltransferase
MDNYEKWESEGSVDTYERANAVWKRMLKEYEPPPLDPGIKEELSTFAEHRRAEIRARQPRTEWKR